MSGCGIPYIFLAQILVVHTSAKVAFRTMSGNAAAPTADRTNPVLLQINNSFNYKSRPGKDLQSFQDNSCLIFSVYIEIY